MTTRKRMRFLLYIVTNCLFVNILMADVQLSCEIYEYDAFLEGVDTPECQCVRPDNNEATFDWTLYPDSGSREHLGKCHSDGNCSTSYDISELEFVVRTDICFLDFHKLTSRFSGILECNVISATFSGSSSYKINMTRMRIHDCPNKLIYEDGSAYAGVECDHSQDIPNTVTWTMLMRNGRLLQLGSCDSSKNYTCTSLLSPNITLTAADTLSTVTFNNSYMNRDVDVVGCSVSFPDHSTEADNCSIDVYSVARMENITLQISRHNWSFVVYFDVQKAFSTEERYDFRLYELFKLLKRGELISASGFVMQDFQSYGQHLVSYINATDKKIYYRGRVVYSWPISPIPGIFTGLNIETFHYVEGESSVEENLTISLPTIPVHNCIDATPHCYCSTEKMGSPAGRLLWLIGNTAVAVGDYGVNQLLLPSDIQTDEQSVVVAMCKLDWIRPLTAQQPVILRGRGAVWYKPLAIVSWTLSVVLIVFVVVFNFIWRGHQGRLLKCSCRKPPEQDEEDITTQN